MRTVGNVLMTAAGILLLSGCGSDAVRSDPVGNRAESVESATVPEPSRSESAEPATAPSSPVNLWQRGPESLRNLPDAEQLGALTGSGGTRLIFNEGATRIREAYYDQTHLRSRWQEQLIDGEWIPHGPEIYIHLGEGHETLHRRDGELHGRRTFYAADGTVTSTQDYDAGMLID